MTVPANLPPQLAIDANSLDRLRSEAQKSPDKALKAAAKQFEAVFLNMMLKSMRDATPQDGMLDDRQTKMYTGMLDQQLAQSMANRGIGLADIMVRQLSHTLDAQGRVDATGKADTASMAYSAGKGGNDHPLPVLPRVK